MRIKRKNSSAQFLSADTNLFLRTAMIFVLVVFWVFSGWPQVTFKGVENKEIQLPPGIPIANAANVYSVQSGTTTRNSSGTTTVTITSVDTTKAFLIFNTNANSIDPATAVRGTINNATTLWFERVDDTTNNSDVNIQWYVIEYTSGVSVQRGSFTQAATGANNVTITAVTGTSSAFVTWSKTVASADRGFSADDTLYCYLSSTTNLRCMAGALNTSFIIAWQVINFTNSSDITVQVGTTSLATAGTSTTQTISSVTTNRTFVLSGAWRYSTANGADASTRMFRTQLTNSTTLTFDRAVGSTSAEAMDIGWQVVELKDGTSVQHGTSTFAAATATATPTITAINTSNAFAFSSFDLGHAGQGSGMTDVSSGQWGNTSKDIIGDANFTFAVSNSTTLTITRASTVGIAKVGWFVVEFKPIANQSGFRFLANANDTTGGTAMAGTSTAATLTNTGDAFRLRLLLSITNAKLAASEINYKLQFAAKSGTCDTSFSGESYADITTSTAISYKDNAAVADGDNLTANASNDPTSGNTIVNQDYEEANNFTNSVAAIPSGQDGMWDFALYDNGATASTDYCLRAVKSDGTVLDTYTYVPQITTAASAGSLSVDIVDSGGTTVASPSVTFSSTNFSFGSTTTTGTLGASEQRIRVANTTATPSWSLTFAATSGTTATWSASGDSYDFNDSNSDSTDDSDADSKGGRLTVDPFSSSTIAAVSPCSSTTGIAAGSSTSFKEIATAVTNITLMTAGASASTSCTWDLTGVSLSQVIPAGQSTGTYTLGFTLTVA